MKKKFLIALFILLSKFLLAQDEKRIEAIGSQFSELLIQQNNLDSFKYAIRIKNLFPDKDFSKFEDSPAEFIVAMLYGAEIELPRKWDSLLKLASENKIDNNAAYVVTYYYKIGVDNYIISSVIKSNYKYYVFSYNLLEWGNEIYISRIYKELKEFENLDEIKTNPFIIIDNEIQEELKELDDLIIPEADKEETD